MNKLYATKMLLALTVIFFYCSGKKTSSVKTVGFHRKQHLLHTNISMEQLIHGAKPKGGTLSIYNGAISCQVVAGVRMGELIHKCNVPWRSYRVAGCFAAAFNW